MVVGVGGWTCAAVTLPLTMSERWRQLFCSPRSPHARQRGLTFTLADFVPCPILMQHRFISFCTVEKCTSVSKLLLQGAVHHLGRQRAANISDCCARATRLLYRARPSPRYCARSCTCPRPPRRRRRRLLSHSSAAHLSPLRSSAPFVVVHTFEPPLCSPPTSLSLSVFASSSLHQSSQGKNHPGNSFPSAPRPPSPPPL